MAGELLFGASAHYRHFIICHPELVEGSLSICLISGECNRRSLDKLGMTGLEVWWCQDAAVFPCVREYTLTKNVSQVKSLLHALLVGNADTGGPAEFRSSASGRIANGTSKGKHMIRDSAEKTFRTARPPSSRAKPANNLQNLGRVRGLADHPDGVLQRTR